MGCSWFFKLFSKSWELHIKRRWPPAPWKSKKTLPRSTCDYKTRAWPETHLLLQNSLATCREGWGVVMASLWGPDVFFWNTWTILSGFKRALSYTDSALRGSWISTTSPKWTLYLKHKLTFFDLFSAQSNFLCERKCLLVLCGWLPGQSYGVRGSDHMVQDG